MERGMATLFRQGHGQLPHFPRQHPEWCLTTQKGKEKTSQGTLGSLRPSALPVQPTRFSVEKPVVSTGPHGPRNLLKDPEVCSWSWSPESSRVELCLGLASLLGIVEEGEPLAPLPPGCKPLRLGGR